MEKRSVNQDVLGRKFGDRYSLILTDPNFERRLRAFDPNLKLMFDQVKKRWTVLEWAPDNSGWNIILVAEDNDERAKALGDWIFNRLYVYRHRYEARRQDPNSFFRGLMDETDRQQTEIDRKSSDDHKHILKDDISQWRKASKELRNRPVSDAVAGYRKITPQSKLPVNGYRKVFNG